MAVLSNNGRLISSLPLASQVLGTDELLVQSNGVTKRLLYSAFTSSILNSSKFNPYTGTVNFNSTNNKFTGSFYSPTGKLANLATVNVSQNLTVVGTTTLSSVTGTLTGNVTGNVTGNLTGNVTGNITSTGTSTFSSIDVNGGAIDGAIIGASSAAAVTGTTITANTGFVGNSTGNLTGDIYNATSTKVLESGNTTPTTNGGVSSAYFYGTSSYATQALTAAYAASGGGVANGLPTGGTQYQILAKTSASDYAVTWTSPITSSNLGNPYNLVVWDGLRSIRDYNNFYYDTVNTYICTARLQSNSGINVLNGGFTGSYVSNLTTQTINSSPGAKVLNGVYNQFIQLTLNANGRVTMSLNSGQTANVLVINTNGSYDILRWSGSTDGGATANTNIYWAGGTVPSITSGVGATKRDLFTFRNINGVIVGSAISNLLTKV